MNKRFTIFICLIALSITSNAQVWQKLNGPYSGSIFSLFINRNNGNIFAGTIGHEIYRSADNGASWTMMNSGSLLLQHPNGFVLNSSGNMFVACDNGVAVTTDNGNSWSSASTSMTSPSIKGIAINNLNVLFCTNYGSGVAVSTNNGITWTNTATGLNSKLVGAITVAPNQNVFVGTYDGLYRSADNGANWVLKSSGISNLDIKCIVSNSSGVLFVGTGNGFFKSTNNGDSWTLATTGMLGTLIESVSITPSGYLYACDWLGYIYYSTNAAASWTRIDKSNARGAYTSAAITDNTVLVGSHDCGISKTVDSGTNWSPANSGINAASIKSMLLTGNGYFFVSVEYQGIYRSSDGGNTWELKNNGYSTLLEDYKNFNTLITTTSGTLYASSDGEGVYASTDNGDTWTRSLTGLTNKYVEGIALHPNGSIFAATSGGGIFVSSDGGTTWVKTNAESIDTYTNAIAIEPNGHIFAAFGSKGVYRSTDLGSSWVQSSTTLNTTQINNITIKSTGDIYAGSKYYGLYKSIDNGETWTSVNLNNANTLVFHSNGNIIAGYGNLYKSTNNGASWQYLNPIGTFVSASCLLFNSLNTLFVGTETNGIYKAGNVVGINTEKEVPNNFSLIQNYPNPFNPVTIIKYSVKETGNVTIKIFDPLGREIALLVNEERAPGSYQVEFNAKNMPSGVYYYQLTSGRYSETKKLVLLK